jgi:hypothetical protein
MVSRTEPKDKERRRNGRISTGEGERESLFFSCLLVRCGSFYRGKRREGTHSSR